VFRRWTLSDCITLAWIVPQFPLLWVRIILTLLPQGYCMLVWENKTGVIDLWCPHEGTLKSRSPWHTLSQEPLKQPRPGPNPKWGTFPCKSKGSTGSENATCAKVLRQVSPSLGMA
jgi:hypothetical protein